MLNKTRIVIHILLFIFSSAVTNSTKTSDLSPAADESLQETNETSTSTEIYSGETLEMIKKASKNEEKPQIEVASRIVWTTPRAALETTKEISTEILQGEKDSYWDTEVNGFQKTSSPVTNEPSGKIITCIVIFFIRNFKQIFL